MERRLEEQGQPEKIGEVNKRHISTTDPDASIVRVGGKSNLCYQTHRAVDPACEVITAVEVTPGEVNEAHRLVSLLDMHQENTGKKDCANCKLRGECTHNQNGRTIKRYLRQAELDLMRELARTKTARQDIKTRQHLMERSFANSTRYGFDHARWRGLWRVNLQEYLIAAIQNIQTLIRHGHSPATGLAINLSAADIKNNALKILNLLYRLLCFLTFSLKMLVNYYLVAVTC